MDPSSDDAATTRATTPSTDVPVSPDKTTTHGGPPTKSPAPDAVQPQELMDRALDFLATASKETLLGVLALLALVTYVVFGRVGLVLIGIGLGVVLHASWEGSTQIWPGEGSSAPKKRRELALEVSQRLLDWPKRAVSDQSTTHIDTGTIAAPEDLSSADLEFTTFRPATAAALRSFTDAVIKDYVKLWYEPILPNEIVFPDSCRRTLTYFVTAISSHLSRKRTEDTFLQFLTNSSSIIIVFLNELAAAFAADPSSTNASQVVDQYLQKCPDSSLANVLSEEQQLKKLNMVADDILSNFLDAKSYSCSPVRDFLREVFARLVLESTITSLSRPEFINDWLIYLLQDGESEIMHAIDAGVEGARNQSVDVSKVSEDSRKALLESTKEEVASQTATRPSNNKDKATEEAVQEVKRLSALIASQDEQRLAHELSSEPVQPQESSVSTEKTNGSRNGVTGDAAELKTTEEAAVSLPASQAAQPVGLASSSPREEAADAPVTLHGASVLVDDDAARSETGVIKSRPTWDYLLQIEPASTRATGWMVFRKYADFQSLHEMLSTVSRLNQIRSFSDQFPTLPAWKGKTRQALAQDLERYLREAMKHESLAETDRMRRFVEKEGVPTDTGTPKQGFAFPSQTAFENMGKELLGALTNAPKGMAGGGRAVFDGVTGVFGGGHNRKLSSTSDRQSQHRKSLSKTDRNSSSASDSTNATSRVNTPVLGSILGASSSSPRPSLEQDSPAQVSSTTAPLGLGLSKEDITQSPESSNKGSSDNLVASEQGAWASKSRTPSPSEDRKSVEHVGVPVTKRDSVATAPQPSVETALVSGSQVTSQGSRRQKMPITTDETQIAVELIFAVINELYTLSSAWNIRRTLLNAAKTYILRPGSPTLETIRGLLQESMIEAHSSDDAIGEYLKKLRENALPTEAELKTWPAPLGEEEKAQLRDTARRLFVQRGIPQALTSVMGAAASREALEKIFDSLQVETVARGFVFSLLLQGLRVLTL